MSPPGIYVHGATTALTRRTVLRKAFLAPWDPRVQQVWLYALADAQRQTGTAVHHSTLVVNHHHTSVTAPGQRRPEFIRRTTRDTSVALHALLRAERYDAPRNLWDARRTHQMRLLDAEAQASHLLYEHLNPVAAGLVKRPEHMPGVTLDFGHWKSGPLTVRRPEVYFGKDRPAELQLHLTPPPLLYRAFGGDLDALVHHMRRLANDGIRALARHRTRPPKGAKALRRLHPWGEPRTLREPGGQPVQTFRIGARGHVSKTQRVHAALEVRGFRGCHSEARVARREGKTDPPFPYGTYAAAHHCGAPVEPEPSDDALVTAPGPMLEAVCAELLEGPVDRSHHAVIAEVEAAFADEAIDIVEHEALDLMPPREADAKESLVVTTHRLERPRVNAAARRVVTHRDRRRGRRKKRATGRHSSDPTD